MLDPQLGQLFREKPAVAQVALNALLAEGIGNREPRERLRHVDRLSLVGERRPRRRGAHQPLGHLHHVFPVLVGAVPLEHGELGVVARRDALVAEIAVDLEHALDTAHDQALEVELRRDAQEEVHVERIVVRLEGSRRSAAGNRLQHRRLDFQIVFFQKNISQRMNNARAHGERLSCLRIDDQVEIALPVPCLLIRQAVEFLRKRAQRLG